MNLPTVTVSGVYMIVNRVSGKVYVGSAAGSLRKRAVNHKSELNQQVHPNVHLQRAWNKYGAEAFEFVVLRKCKPENCLRWEQHWIDKLDAFRTGYNRNPKAGSRLGTKHTEETKLKMRLVKLGKKMSPESRAKMSAARMGRGWTPSQKANNKRTHWAYGPNADAIKAKMGMNHRGGNSEETRRRISESKRLKRQSQGE